MRKSLLTCCLVGAAVIMNAPARAQDDDEFRPLISVTGEGRATAPPDMATIHTGVVTQAPSASEALDQNNEAMERIMSVLEQQQIAPKDIQTSTFNVSPVYKQDRQGRQQPEIVAYQVTNQVRVNVRDLSKLGQALDALVEAGSNRLSGISFEIEDLREVLNQARQRAVADARHRAETYAEAAGVKVGKVLTISEQPVGIPRPVYQARALAAEAAAVPVAAGEQELQVTVQVEFALEYPE